MPNQKQIEHREKFIEELVLDKEDLSRLVFVIQINAKNLTNVEKALDEAKHHIPFHCLVGMGSRYKEKEYGFSMNISTDPLHKHTFD
jgi:hypothetical protein